MAEPNYTTRFNYAQLAERMRRTAQDVLETRSYPEAVKLALVSRMRATARWFDLKAHP